MVSLLNNPIDHGATRLVPVEFAAISSSPTPPILRFSRVRQRILATPPQIL
jgi:hypothetical protein